MTRTDEPTAALPAADPQALVTTNEPNAMKPAARHYFRGQLLIGTQSLSGDFFQHAVVYVCDHDERGAMGLVINQLTPYSLLDLMSQLEMDEPDDPSIAVMIPVHRGGPVEANHGFVLHDVAFEHEGSKPIDDHFALGFSRDLLALMAQKKGPEHAIVVLGYAGWGPGQLEREVADDAWLVAPAEPTIVFEGSTEDLWARAARSLGVDMDRLGPHSGHA
ncbi:MAG: YqgE/AlgH family protein [Thioalkalivibrionaceae bacterium]